MFLLKGHRRSAGFAAVATLIEPRSSVVDVCCGTAKIFRDHLKKSSVEYLGLDENENFIQYLGEQGISARLFDLLREPSLPEADYLVMCGSLYHFRNVEAEVLDKMTAAARKAVIIAEPVRNLSEVRSPWVAKALRKLTTMGTGRSDFRYSIETFKEFAKKHQAASFIFNEGDSHAIAVFRGRARR